MSLVAATGDILLKSVLIATDFSEASDKPLRHALAIARHGWKTAKESGCWEEGPAAGDLNRALSLLEAAGFILTRVCPVGGDTLMVRNVGILEAKPAQG
jgi:hypothetical protein